MAAAGHGGVDDLHCVVTGGGLDERGQWHATRPRFLFPVRVLGKLFRGKLLDALRRLYGRGKLVLSAAEPNRTAFEPHERETGATLVVDGKACQSLGLSDWSTVHVDGLKVCRRARNNAP